MYFLLQSKQTSTRTVEGGFGLVELMVTISIMMLLSAIILVRNTAFNGAVLLRSQAYEVAFAIRRAQLMAVSGNNSGTTNVIQQYGVYFDISTPNAYFIFHDVNADGKWNPPDVKIGTLGTIDKRFKIAKISNSKLISGSSITETGVGFNVTFRRPNFDGIFENAKGTYFSGPVYIDVAQVNAAANDGSAGAVRRVEVGATGEISVTGY